MIRTWQHLSNASNEGRILDVEIPVRRVGVSSTVVGRPQGYELDSTYVDNDFYRCLFYLSPEDGVTVTEVVDDFFGFGYLEVYIKRSGRCPESPDFVYVADTPHNWVELVTFAAALGGVRKRRGDEFDY